MDSTIYAGLCVATRLADFEDGAEAGLRGTGSHVRAWGHHVHICAVWVLLIIWWNIHYWKRFGLYIYFYIYTDFFWEHVCKMWFEEASLPGQQVLIAQWATCLGTTSNGDVCCLSPVEIDMQMYFSIFFFLNIDNRYPSYVSLEIYLCVWILTWFMIHLRSYHYLCTSICYMLLFHWITALIVYDLFSILVFAAEDNMSTYLTFIIGVTFCRCMLTQYSLSLHRHHFLFQTWTCGEIGKSLVRVDVAVFRRDLIQTKCSNAPSEVDVSVSLLFVMHLLFSGKKDSCPHRSTIVPWVWCPSTIPRRCGGELSGSKTAKMTRKLWFFLNWDVMGLFFSDRLPPQNEIRWFGDLRWVKQERWVDSLDLQCSSFCFKFLAFYPRTIVSKHFKIQDIRNSEGANVSLYWYIFAFAYVYNM